MRTQRIMKATLALAAITAITAGCGAATASVPSRSTTTTTSAETSASASGASKLVATAKIKSELEAAYATYQDGFANNDLKASEVAIRPGTLFYGVDHQTDSYWAVAAFGASAAALAECPDPSSLSAASVACEDQPKFADLQYPGSAPNVLARVGSTGRWVDIGPFLFYSEPTTTCAPGVSADLLAAWGMSPGNCHFTDGL